MSGRYGIRLLAVSVALVALVLFAGIGTAAAAPPSEMTTIVTEVADCDDGKVVALGTSENCLPSFTVPLLAFGDFVDPNPVTNCGRERWRGFLQFPLDDIPPHARIVDAKLKVFVQYPWLPAPGSVKISVHRVVQGWDPDSPSFIWPGPVYSRRPVDTKPVSTPMTFVTWDVTPIVQGWVHGVPNHGVVFKAENEGSNANIFAACPDCWIEGRNPLLPPPPSADLNKATLTVTYVEKPGRR